jgi:hypothetical protein
MRFNARLDTYRHGPPQSFKDAGVVGDVLTGIRLGSASLLSAGGAYIWGLNVPASKNPDDSSQVSMDAAH